MVNPERRPALKRKEWSKMTPKSPDRGRPKPDARLHAVAKLPEAGKEVLLYDRRILDVLAPLTKPKQKVAVITGNGLNASSSGLSTQTIVEEFMKKSSSANPRDHEKRSESATRLADALKCQGHCPDMYDFMSDYQSLEEVKDAFVSHVIESCCLSHSGLSHQLLLLACGALRGYGGKGHKLVIFTTNYDNLLERAYLGRMLMRPRAQVRFYPGDEPFPTGIQTAAGRPRYTLTTEQHAKILPVIPLHGSIRVCRCPNCRRELSSEAAAVGRKRCVYCGREIPRVVVPTTEGEADKEVLRVLEDWVAESALVISAGYSFGDPHIAERIRRGVIRRKSTGPLGVIGLCHKAIQADKMGLPDGNMVFNRMTDVNVGLAELLTAVSTRLSGPIVEECETAARRAISEANQAAERRPRWPPLRAGWTE